MKKFKYWKYPRDGQIYILPTWYGFWYGVMVFLSLLIAFYYQNNFTFVLVFLFTAFGVISLVQTHFHLKSFQVKILSIESNHVDKNILFKSLIERGKLAETLLFSISGDNAVTYEESGKCVWRERYSKRGKRKVSKFMTATEFPFGLFRAWRWTYCDYDFYIYPKLSDEGISFRQILNEGEGNRGELGMEDISSLERWKKGDSYRHILWRKFSPFRQWQVKKFQGGAAQVIHLSFDQLQLDKEEYISRCTKSLRDFYKATDVDLKVLWGDHTYSVDEKVYYLIMEKLAEYKS